MSVADSLYSPESTVTSLLASSGYLRSSLHTDASHPSITYKDRQYGSATEALDAYIKDFERSQGTADQAKEEHQLSKDAVSHVLSRPRFRNKDVLKEKLSEKELDFLDLPIDSRRTRDPDLLSLTTDDLLVLPPDGSLPITRTSVFLSRSGRQHPDAFSHSRSGMRSCADPSHTSRTSNGVLVKDTYMHQKKAVRNQELQDVLCTQSGHRTTTYEKHKLFLSTHLNLEKRKLNTNSAHNYPRWLTSQKSEMDFSGITSVPDMKYPAWLKDCDLASDLSGNDEAVIEVRQSLCHTQRPTTQPKIPSWLEDLEASYYELQQNTDDRLRATSESVRRIGLQKNDCTVFKEEAGQNSLPELREAFAGHLTSEETRRIANYDEPFRDDKIELLIQKAEKALASPSLGLSRSEKEHGSPETEEVLDADRSWDNPPISFKTPVPVGEAEELLNPTETARSKLMDNYMSDCREVTGSSSSGYSSRKHPGPVEALKHMLFSLQAVEQRVSQEHTGQHQQDNSKINSKPTLENYETALGSQSLQRALYHLGRLKNLVDDMKEKEEDDELVQNENHFDFEDTKKP
ncbi:lung adenoma susceptibility protein 2 [Lepisosteus oculatus]|uniref:lung adenoma susceptibility protein 2 n=1 Tax=Lepisosteus oculatus TaxID=7918 RepID=UPI003710067D